MKTNENLIIIEGVPYTKEYVFNVYVESMSKIAKKRYYKMNTRVCEVDDYINEVLTCVWNTVCNRLNPVNEYWQQVTICINNWVQDALNNFDMYAMNSISLSRSSYRRYGNVKYDIIRRKSEYLKAKGLEISLIPVDALLTYPVEEVDTDIDYIILESMGLKNDSMEIGKYARNSINAYKSFIEHYKTQFSLDKKYIERETWFPQDSIQDVTFKNRCTKNVEELHQKEMYRKELISLCSKLGVTEEDINAIIRGRHNQNLRKKCAIIANSEFSSIIKNLIMEMSKIEERIEVLI